MLVSGVIPIAFVSLVVIAIYWIKSRSRINAPITVTAAELTRSSDGAVTIPVRGLENRGRFSNTKNSIRPTLQIHPGGLRYKIFRQAELPFAAISRVDARKGLFGGGHLLVYSDGNQLSITVGDLGTAKAFLAALPPSVPVSADAATLRDSPPFS